MSEHEFELYLKLLSRCLGLTTAQREQIADELRDHLEERLEELAREGVPRDKAVLQAVEEFGDASALAAHFTAIARIRRRRLMMRLSVGSVAALGLACFAALAMWPENQALQGPARVVAETKAQDEKDELPGPIKVEVAHPIARDVADYVVCPGFVVPSQKVEIRAQVTDYLEKSSFPAGGAVKTGDVLFEIDAQRQMADVQRAQAEVARAEAHAKRMEAQVERTKLLAQVAGNATVSQADVATSQADWEEAFAQVEAAKIDLKIAQVDLGYTRLIAPISGQLSRPSIDRGNLVEANETRLAELICLDPVCVELGMDTSTFLRLRKGVRDGEFKESEIPVTIALDGQDAIRGTLESLNGVIDTRRDTVDLRAMISNADSQLVPGLQPDVRVETSKPYAGLLVPNGAVTGPHPHDGARYAFVVNAEQVIEDRKVTVSAGDGKVVVIRDGLKPDDWVVSQVNTSLHPGLAVEPVETTLKP